MSNTRKSIAASIQIKDYPLKPTDIFEIDSDTGAIFGEIQGKRKSQEDYMGASKLVGFETLSASGHEKVFQDAMRLMHKDCDPRGMIGSTACAGVAWREDSKLHVTVGHVGDSEAYVVVVAENGEVKVVRVNKYLHRPNEPTERARLKKTNRVPQFTEGAWRIKGLNVSRAIGDKFDLTEPDDHAPDVDSVEIALAFGDKSYLVVACDGLFENLDSDEEKVAFLANVFKQSSDPDRLIGSLIDGAYSRSRDNISAIILPVTSAQATSVAVFDGHNGSQISNKLSQFFYPLLRGLVEEEVRLRKTQVRVSEMISTVSPHGMQASDLLQKAMHLKNNDQHHPFSLLSRMHTSVVAASNKKAALIQHLPNLMKHASRGDILDAFNALEDVNGEYAWIHVQKHKRFDKLRMFFGGHSKNAGEETRWHTRSYQQAVKILKEAYLKAPELTEEDRLAEEAKFIDYRRGNAPKLFASKRTSLRKALEREASHPDQVKLVKSQ